VVHISRAPAAGKVSHGLDIGFADHGFFLRFV